jgi:NADPH:quinone reductase-like Zn-dependent oxidoreductase
VLIRATAAGVIEDAGKSGLALGSRVMFTGPYGVAASLPVAYLTAQLTLTLAGFKPGMTVLAPGIGGSVGNATYQLGRAQGAGKVISTAGGATKAAKARELGFEDARADGWLLPVRPISDVIAAAWRDILPLIVNGSVRPIVERACPFGQAREALRHLIEDRPFGKVVLAG